ncbi:peptide deformylase [Paenibacillus antri]|uniref:Peptide deformylase n=1 Tax=Paenibacillus antri TaxID=2582848 RepID=A0A5R9G6L4_9BACL|nr:peptide deformylase [Paenibacillus antri]TLS49750.1 peptide deformylase [Paenibacillus antri]
MVVRTILPFGDPALRAKAKPVGEITPRILKTLEDLADTLYADEGRAGLAAPQIGIHRRLAVLDMGEGLIDPRIAERRGSQIGFEACLSFPGFFGQVERASYVRVESLDRQGRRVTLEAEGDVARCMQHEIDHLDGVLFVDHVRDRWLIHEKTKQKLDVLDVVRRTYAKDGR